MFEQNPNLKNSANQPSTAPPPNLPTAGAEDIFSEVDKTSPKIQGPAKPLELIMPGEAGPTKEEISERKSTLFKKIKLIIIIIVGVSGLSILVLAGWLIYVQLTRPGVAPSSQPLNQVNWPAGNVNLLINQPVNPPAEVDSDQDGLIDEEERLYGTNPLNVDTDADGLTDRDEAKVFKTDPTNPDTDGDGYKDGEEVRKGYDPKGPGRLFKVQ